MLNFKQILVSIFLICYFNYGFTQSKFTVGLIPDTQYLTDRNGNLEDQKEDLRKMYRFFNDRKSSLNLKFVAHVGDLTEDDSPAAPNGPGWDIIDEVYHIFRNNNIPFSVARGNHDDQRELNRIFPISYFNDKSWFGGHLAGNFQAHYNRGNTGTQCINYTRGIENSYYYFNGGGQQYMVLNLDFFGDNGGGAERYDDEKYLVYQGNSLNQCQSPPSAPYNWERHRESTQWAKNILCQNLDKPVIVVTHWLYSQDELNDIIKDYPNVFMTVVGHITKDRYDLRNWNEKRVHQFQFDYQRDNDVSDEGTAVKYLEFDPAAKQVRVKTYAWKNNNGNFLSQGSGEWNARDFSFSFNPNDYINKPCPTGGGNNQPDLKFQTVSINDNSVNAGQNINVQSLIRNAGNANASNVRLKVYLSTNNSVSSDDHLLTNVVVGNFNSGTESSKTINVSIPSNKPSGNYHIVWHLDPEGAISESDEANNFASKSITISSSPPTTCNVQNSSVLLYAGGTSTKSTFAFQQNLSSKNLQGIKYISMDVWSNKNLSNLSSRIELTSSGNPDNGEYAAKFAHKIKGTGQWETILIPFDINSMSDQIFITSGNQSPNINAINFLRLYVSNEPTGTYRLRNVKAIFEDQLIYSGHSNSNTSFAFQSTISPSLDLTDIQFVSFEVYSNRNLSSLTSRLELSSSGTYDHGEYSTKFTDEIIGQSRWKRITIPFDINSGTIDIINGNTTANISRINFFRVYVLNEPSGNYRIRNVRAIKGCGNTSSNTRLASQVETLEQVSEYNVFSYPNPFTDFTYLNITLPTAEKVIVEVYNRLGQQVFFHKELMEIGENNVQIDGSQLPVGLYFYKVTTTEHSFSGQLNLIK